MVRSKSDQNERILRVEGALDNVEIADGSKPDYIHIL